MGPDIRQPHSLGIGKVSKEEMILDPGQSGWLSHSVCPLPAPVSHPVLTLQHEATNLAVGDKVEFLCEAHQGSLPIFYSFYINGEILGKPLAPSGRAASLLASVKAEWSTKNYSCEAKNNISREISELKKFPLVGMFCIISYTPVTVRNQTSLLCNPTIPASLSTDPDWSVWQRGGVSMGRGSIATHNMIAHASSFWAIHLPSPLIRPHAVPQSCAFVSCATLRCIFE